MQAANCCSRPKSVRALDELRSGLQDPERGIRAHHVGQPRERRSGDQAVRVEHDHVIVAAAPTGDEVLDVAGFARDVAPPPAIPHRNDRRERSAQPVDRDGLADPRVGVGRIREYDDFEAAVRADLAERLRHGLQRRGGAGRILVVNRHDQCGERAAARRPRIRRRGRSRIAPLRGAGDHRAGRERDPRQGNGEEENHRSLQERHAREAHDLEHLVNPVGGDPERHGHEDEAGEQHRARRAAQRHLPGGIAQILGGHAQAAPRAACRRRTRRAPVGRRNSGGGPSV